MRYIRRYWRRFLLWYFERHIKKHTVYAFVSDEQIIHTVDTRALEANIKSDLRYRMMEELWENGTLEIEEMNEPWGGGRKYICRLYTFSFNIL